MWSRIRTFVNALRRRSRMESEMDAELVFHREEYEAELVRSGVSQKEARRRACIAFGTVDTVKEDCRQALGLRLVDELHQDVRYALRSLASSRGFTAGAVLVLALGIGANCAIFSLVHSVLLEPLPYERPEEVVMLWRASRQPDGSLSTQRTATNASVRLWRENSEGVLSDLAGLRTWDSTPEAWFDLVLRDRAERLRAALVTPNFFSVLGARAAMGRVFSPEDAAAGHFDLIVLSHGLWQRAFGGDPDIVGRSVTFMSGRGDTRAGRPYTVVGVLPAAFRFTYPLETEVWAMYSWSEVRALSPMNLAFDGTVARLAEGVTFEAADARMRDVPSIESSPGVEPRYYTGIQPITEWVVGETRPSMLLLAGVALLLLLIACATVANALLVRLAERRRELAVRASLGAGGWRLTRQLLTEGFTLSAAGAVGGTVLAVVLQPVFRSLVPFSVPRGDEMTVDVRVLLFGSAAAALVTVMAALAPVIHAARVDMASAMKSSSGSASAAPGTVRWRFAFVTAQAAVATAVLVGAILLLISLWRLHHVDLGYDADEVLTVEMRLVDESAGDEVRISRLQRELKERVRVLPGVIEVGMTSAVPLRGVDWSIRYHPVGGREYAFSANMREVDPEYFSVMRIPLVSGRYFTVGDVANSEPVAVVTESAARELFSGENPLGKQIVYRRPITIVGVVKDVRYQGLDQDPRPAVYLPRSQQPSELICLVLRTSGEIDNMAATLRRAIHEVEPTLPAMNITTIGNIISGSVSDRRFYTTTTASFATLALLLVAAGLVVVITRSIAERRSELAIRSALGARTADLVSLVTGQGTMPVILGTILGLWGAWIGSRILEQFLFEVTIHEPAVYVGAGALALVVAVLACVIPARRISRLQPAEVLKCE